MKKLKNLYFLLLLIVVAGSSLVLCAMDGHAANETTPLQHPLVSSYGSIIASQVPYASRNSERFHASFDQGCVRCCHATRTVCSRSFGCPYGEEYVQCCQTINKLCSFVCASRQAPACRPEVIYHYSGIACCVVTSIMVVGCGCPC